MSTAEDLSPERIHSPEVLTRYVDDAMSAYYADFEDNYLPYVKGSSRKELFRYASLREGKKYHSKNCRFARNDDIWQKAFIRVLESFDELDKKADIVALNPFMGFIVKGAENCSGSQFHVPAVDPLFMMVNKRIEYHLDASSSLSDIDDVSERSCRVVVTQDPVYDPYGKNIIGFNYAVCQADKFIYVER